MYGGTVTLQVVLATERALAATVRAHILLNSLRIVSVHVCLQVERTGKRWQEERLRQSTRFPTTDTYHDHS
jgi:hypothetical protein